MLVSGRVSSTHSPQNSPGSAVLVWLVHSEADRVADAPRSVHDSDGFQGLKPFANLADRCDRCAGGTP